MKLYHGTSSRCLESILTTGIKPREGRKGNWKHSVLSNRNAVYLTSVYSIYFAQCAVRDIEREKLAIIEIDTNLMSESLFAPDEDFLEQASRADPNIPVFGKPMRSRVSWFKPRAHKNYQHLWSKSLENLGTCAYYDTVNPWCFTRIALLPYNHPVRHLSDPIVCTQNFHLIGGFYRNLTKYLFGETDFEASLMWNWIPGFRELPGRDGIEVKVLK